MNEFEKDPNWPSDVYVPSQDTVPARESLLSNCESILF